MFGVQRKCLILPGTNSFSNLAGNLFHRCGIFESPNIKPNEQYFKILNKQSHSTKFIYNLTLEDDEKSRKTNWSEKANESDDLSEFCK